MIARLRGRVERMDDNRLIVDVNGVGYLVYCSARTASALQPAAGAAVLEIETRMRDDGLHLYGFADAAERECFRLLTSVQGVGARVALAVLSVLSPPQLADAVIAEDKTAVARANGVGMRLAGRIVGELKDKLGGDYNGLNVGAALAGDAGGGRTAGGVDDAVSALVNLGYARGDAFSAVARAARGGIDSADAGALIRAALAELGR